MKRADKYRLVHTKQIEFLRQYVQVYDTITFWCYVSGNEPKMVESTAKVIDIYPRSSEPSAIVYLVLDGFSIDGVRYKAIGFNVDYGCPTLYPFEDYNDKMGMFVFLKMLDDFWFSAMYEYMNLFPKNVYLAELEIKRIKKETNIYDLSPYELRYNMLHDVLCLMFGRFDPGELNKLIDQEWISFNHGKRHAVVLNIQKTFRRNLFTYQILDVAPTESEVDKKEKTLFPTKRFLIGNTVLTVSRDKDGKVKYDWPLNEKTKPESSIPIIVAADKYEELVTFISKRNREVMDTHAKLLEAESKAAAAYNVDASIKSENRKLFEKLIDDIFDQQYEGWMEKEGLKSFTNNT